MKAIIFSRVSTMIQDLEQQETTLYQAAKADGFKDEDIITISEHESAVKNDISERLGISKAKEAIKNQKVKVIYAFELSRIARRLDVFYEFRKFLIENKVQLKILNPKVQLLTEDGEIDENFSLVFSIFASLAEQEARLMQARFKRGKEKLREKHLYAGGDIPFGYTVNKDKEYVIKEDEAELIRDIYEMYKTMTVRDIAKELVLTGRYDGAINSAQTLIRNILHREYYTGRESSYNGFRDNRHSYKFPAIISCETFDETKKKIHDRKKYTKTRCKNDYLCRGLVVNINGEKLKAYACHNAYTFVKVNKFDWETLSIKMDLLDKVALYCAIENKKRKPGKDLMKYKVELQQELKVISKKVSTIDKKIEEANDRLIKIETRYIYGKITEEMVNILSLKENNIINSLKEESQCLEAEGEDLKKRLNNLLQSGKESFLGHFSELTLQEQYQAVHEEIEKIIVIKGKSQNSFTLGVQFINGDYRMLDLNSRSGKLWSESGELVEYENLLTSQQGGK